MERVERALTSPFAVCAGDGQAPLLHFLEQQTEVLGAVDRPLALDLLKGRRDLRLLDFGCGEGSYLQALVKSAPTGSFAEVCGIDINPEWIEIADRRDYQAPATFVEADICAMDGWLESRFDMILSRFTMISAKDPLSAIRTAHRALKPGGLMVAIESSYSVAQTLCTSPTMAEFCTRMKRWYGLAGSDPDLAPRLWHWFQQNDFTLQRELVVIYGNNTLGAERLAEFTATSARQLGQVYPDVFPHDYCEQLARALVDEFEAGMLGCMATHLVAAQKA